MALGLAYLILVRVLSWLVLLARSDTGKIGLADFITVCPVRAVQTVVTDRADTALSQWLDAADVELVIADQQNNGASSDD